MPHPRQFSGILVSSFAACGPPAFSIGDFVALCCFSAFPRSSLPLSALSPVVGSLAAPISSDLPPTASGMALDRAPFATVEDELAHRMGTTSLAGADQSPMSGSEPTVPGVKTENTITPGVPPLGQPPSILGQPEVSKPGRVEQSFFDQLVRDGLPSPFIELSGQRKYSPPVRPGQLLHFQRPGARSVDRCLPCHERQAQVHSAPRAPLGCGRGNWQIRSEAASRGDF